MFRTVLSVLAALLLTLSITASAQTKPAMKAADGTLTNAAGMTLYVFDRDAGGKSACNGPCAALGTFLGVSHRCVFGLSAMTISPISIVRQIPQARVGSHRRARAEANDWSLANVVRRVLSLRCSGH